jgi:phenylacetate-CoA ligase
MGWKDTIYQKSPYFIKYALFNIGGYLNYKKRYDLDYNKYLLEYLNNWNSSREDIMEYQKNQLINLLKDCFIHVPYYRKIMLEKNISISDIESMPYETLKLMPLLKKIDRKAQIELLINQNPLRPTAEIGYTSGTSGSPMINYIDKESNERSFALWTRFHRVIKLPQKFKTIRFSGRLIISPTTSKPPFWMENRFGKQLFMSSYHLKNEYLQFYINKINDYKPELIDGYPSSIYVISKFINDNKIQLDFRPIAICTTAETLYDYQRTEIEKAFFCKVFNQYASSEGSPFITECRDGNLHINEDSGVFEILNSDDLPAKKGEIGRLVVTSFRNLKTPLIRYDIEDTVLLSNQIGECKCGCEMPVIEKLIGREDDILWTEEKGYIGRMDTAYKGLIGIVKSQIIQKSPREIIVNNIVDKDYTDLMNSIFIQNLKDRMGENIDIKINIVEDIPLSSNGKFDAVIREFDIKL